MKENKKSEPGPEPGPSENGTVPQHCETYQFQFSRPILSGAVLVEKCEMIRQELIK